MPDLTKTSSSTRGKNIFFKQLSELQKITTACNAVVKVNHIGNVQFISEFFFPPQVVDISTL